MRETIASFPEHVSSGKQVHWGPSQSHKSRVASLPSTDVGPEETRIHEHFPFFPFWFSKSLMILQASCHQKHSLPLWSHLSYSSLSHGPRQPFSCCLMLLTITPSLVPHSPRHIAFYDDHVHFNFGYINPKQKPSKKSAGFMFQNQGWLHLHECTLQRQHFWDCKVQILSFLRCCFCSTETHELKHSLSTLQHNQHAMWSSRH